MPQPIGHFCVIENGINIVESPSMVDLWTYNSKYAVFGSIFPDVMYMSGVPKLARLTTKGHRKDYSEISDIFHQEGSLDMYCCMLDYIKEISDKGTQDKLKAFAYGFISHVITDADVHPRVYAQTGDNPFFHSDIEFTRHKSLESLIDIFILGRRKITYREFNYDARLSCHEQDSNRTLDHDIFKMAMHCIENIYGGTIFDNRGFDYYKDFRSFEGSPEHPVLEAYRDIVKLYRFFDKFYWLGGLLSGLPIIPTRFRVLLPKTMIRATELNKIEPDPRKKWVESSNPNVPDLSFPELFDIAVIDTKAVISESERFFDSSYSRSGLFFSNNSSNTFLRDNINLDTGRPVEFNEDIKSLKNPTPANVLEPGLEALTNRYEKSLTAA